MLLKFTPCLLPYLGERAEESEPGTFSRKRNSKEELKNKHLLRFASSASAAVSTSYPKAPAPGRSVCVNRRPETRRTPPGGGEGTGSNPEWRGGAPRGTGRPGGNNGKIYGKPKFISNPKRGSFSNPDTNIEKQLAIIQRRNGIVPFM